jgi:hypothetical protein
MFLLPLTIAASQSLVDLLRRGLERLRLPRIAGVLDRVTTAYRGLIRSPGLVALVVALSIAMKACVAWIIHLLATALGLRVGWGEVVVFLPLHTVVSALPVSVNGLGVREANLVGFFRVVGLTEEQGAALALLHLVWLYATAVPGGLLLLRSRAFARSLPSGP